MRALVLSDTHLGAGRAEHLVELLGARLRVASAILHAGDVTDDAVLVALARFAPVHAVLGNNDHGLTLPEQLVVELGGCRVAMVHDSGATKGRAARMHRRFPGAAVVVYGHSHQPDDSVGVDGQRLLNPGSCIERRRAPHRTYALLDLVDGTVRDHRIVALDG